MPASPDISAGLQSTVTPKAANKLVIIATQSTFSGMQYTKLSSISRDVLLCMRFASSFLLRVNGETASGAMLTSKTYSADNGFRDV